MKPWNGETFKRYQNQHVKHFLTFSFRSKMPPKVIWKKDVLEPRRTFRNTRQVSKGWLLLWRHVYGWTRITVAQPKRLHMVFQNQGQHGFRLEFYLVFTYIYLHVDLTVDYFVRRTTNKNVTLFLGFLKTFLFLAAFSLTWFSSHDLLDERQQSWNFISKLRLTTKSV